MKRRMQLAGWTLFDAAVHVRTDPVIRDRLLSLADLVIANYRQEQPTVGRAEWEQAHGWLTRAVTLYPENKIVLARLRYTEGHLQRLTGQKRAEESGQAKQARQSYYAAVQKFREAAALDPKTPDPYLGLTHTYVYGLGRRRQRGGLAEQRREARLQVEPARARAAWRRVSRPRRARVADGARAGGRSEARRLRARAQGLQALRRIFRRRSSSSRTRPISCRSARRASPSWTSRSRRGGSACSATIRRKASRSNRARPTALATRRVRTNRDEADPAIPAAARGERRHAAPVDASRLHAARFRHGRRLAIAIRRASFPAPVPAPAPNPSSSSAEPRRTLLVHNIELAGLLVVTLAICFGALLTYFGQIAPLAEDEARLARGEIVNLNGVRSAKELMPALEAALPDTSDRTFAARRTVPPRVVARRRRPPARSRRRVSAT